MIGKHGSILNPKKRYLQIALNGTLSDAKHIIATLPRSDRIILEAGTPFIKRYGISGIASLHTWYGRHLLGQPIDLAARARPQQITLGDIVAMMKKNARSTTVPLYEKETTIDAPIELLRPYIVADLKMMDRGVTEVELAKEAGASAATALGHAPIESLNAFIDECEHLGIDSMIDMMNVEFPIGILRALKRPPNVVILHRGVDEERFNKGKMLPLHEIRRVKGAYDIMIAVAGGDTVRDVGRAMFNDADIAVVWKDFYHGDGGSGALAEEFLREIR